VWKTRKSSFTIPAWPIAVTRVQGFYFSVRLWAAEQFAELLAGVLHSGAVPPTVKTPGQIPSRYLSPNKLELAVSREW